MRQSKGGDFLVQLMALMLSAIVVHALYVAWVRPEAARIQAEQRAMIAADPAFVPERSAFVILRDHEQEACFILMLWALAIMAFKAVQANREYRLLDRDLVGCSEGNRILPEDARTFTRGVQALPERDRTLLLPRALLGALQRFASTGKIQDVSDTAMNICENEAERLDSELSLIRYIAWAIPSIGFLGTVRGIGSALGQAHKAVDGDIVGVTDSLGVAFNSTFVALLISIVLMFLLHQLQLRQERLVMDAQGYLDQQLIQHLKESAS